MVKKCMPPVPKLVPEPVGSFTVGTPVKYNGQFYTVGEINGTFFGLYGFDVHGNPIPDVTVHMQAVQRFKVV